MTFNYDKWGDIEEPQYYLSKASGEIIGNIKCLSKTYTKKTDYNEISFSTNLFLDGKENPLYPSIIELQHIHIPGIGNFVIDSVNISGESSEYETKECHAASEEILLAKKFLEEFYINIGTTGSIDGVSLYDLSNPQKSLIHLILDKCPDWNIGHMDAGLAQKQRCFSIDRQDILSFLKNDIQEAFECVVVFDTISHTINVYNESSIGKDTDICLTYDKLVNNVSVSSSIDDIVTCLVVTGADDLSIREVNMGYDRIYNLDYFHSQSYMSSGLYNAYSSWKTKWNEKVVEYESLVTQYQDLYKQILYLISEKMPDDPESTDWTEYGLNPLKEKLASYEKQQSVMIKAGQADVSSPYYETLYLPCYNTIQSINEQISNVENEINSLKESQKSIAEQMDLIILEVEMKNNFSQEQLNELAKFIREENISSDNFVVTDTMNESDRMDMLHEMLDYGRKELAKKAQPNISFSVDMNNLFEIIESPEIKSDFDLYNYIHVIMRDDYVVKPRILSIAFDFMEHTVSATFGNIALGSDGILSDITDSLSFATTAATSVSFNASHWNQANRESTSIGKMLSDGLLSAGEIIKTSNSDFAVDDRGLFVRNTENNDGVFIGGGQILFTDDDFESVKTALGRVSYTKDGTTYNDFGLLAQFVIAGYVAGSTIEGNEILGGSITGSTFNNGNGTFSVDENGKLIAKSGTVGGWTITDNKMYAGDTENGEKTAVVQKPSSNTTWVFAAGGSSHSSYSDCPFRVDKNGKLYATDAVLTGKIEATAGKFGGINVDTNKIYSDNNKVVINSNGSATFKDVSITGVQAGSSFGGISYGATGTYGNLNGGFSAGTSFGLSGGALTDFDNLVANKVTANYISAAVQLDAVKADIEFLQSDVSHFRQVFAGEIQANTLKVNSANIYGSIVADQIRLRGDDGNYTIIDKPIDILAVSSVAYGEGVVKDIELCTVRVWGQVIVK